MWVSCRIRSESHTLSDQPFRLFQTTESNIRVHDVNERDFVLSVRIRNEADSEHIQLHHGNNLIRTFLIALNVGALGSFYWYDDPWVHPVLTVRDDFASSAHRMTALVVESSTAYEELVPLVESNVYNVGLVFGILARETSMVLTGEYCRGLLLLRMNFYDLNFRKEAFMCFYRALEHFVAARLLGVKRLSNELRDLKRGLAGLTKDQALIDELNEVYKVRSSQIAHSQTNQREITFDEVMKAKVFLDFVMHKKFKSDANQLLASRSEPEA